VKYRRVSDVKLSIKDEKSMKQIKRVFYINT